jgi:hypothetical protein
MAIIIRIIFFLFNTNPNIPIKNKNNERFIVLKLYPLGTFNKGYNNLKIFPSPLPAKRFFFLLPPTSAVGKAGA